MRITKLLASLQLASLAAAVSPIDVVYRRSFNESKIGGSSSISAGFITAGTVTPFRGADVTGSAGSTGAATHTTKNATSSATSSIVADAIDTSVPTSDITSPAASASVSAAGVVSIVNTTTGTTVLSTSSTYAPTLESSSATFKTIVSSKGNEAALNNGTATTSAPAGFTLTTITNTTVSDVSLVNGTATVVATKNFAVAQSTSANLTAPASTSLANVTSTSGGSQDCESYYIAEAGDSCAKVATIFSMSISSFLTLNPSLHSCSALVTGATYCVSPNGQSAVNTTSTNANSSGLLSSPHYALLNGTTVVVANITSTVAGAVAIASAAGNASGFPSFRGSNITTIGNLSVLASTILTAPFMANAVQVLSPATQAITELTTTTEYLTVDVTKTDYATSTVYVATVTNYVTKYVTATFSALEALGQPNTLITNSACTARTVVITLPASLSPSITATPGDHSVPSATTPTPLASGTGSGTGSSPTTVQFCPDLNGTVWTDPQGTEQLIYCNMSFDGTTINAPRIGFGGNSTFGYGNGTLFGNGTLSGNYSLPGNTTLSPAAPMLHRRAAAATTSLAQCISQCDELTNCVGTAYDGTTCTFYSSLTTPHSSQGVEFARAVAVSASSSTKGSTVRAATGTSTVICNPSATSIIRANRPHPTVFCQTWNANKPHSNSPFPKLAVVQVSNACGCILAYPLSVTTSTTIHTSSATVKSSSVKTSSKSASSTKSTSGLTVATSSKTTSASVKTSTTSKCSTATPPGPTQTGIVSGCTKWYVAQSGDYCSLVAGKYSISVDTFMAWNPAVNAPSCNNMQIGDAYCVAVGCSSSGGSTTLTSSTGTSKTSSQSSSSSTSTAVPYKMYTGNGTVAAGWPAQSQWLDFATLFTLNTPIMQESCENNWQVPNDSANEIAELKAAILDVSSSTGVDARFILAIVMQESNGCVRVITTSYSVENTGLMQSHAGNGTCNNQGTVQNPCPQAEIHQMIQDGTAGTSSGDGLKQCLTETDVSDVSKYYRAARIYNGGLGGYNPDNLGSGCCTLCYSSDVANRLVGWSTGTSQCTLS